MARARKLKVTEDATKGLMIFTDVREGKADKDGKAPSVTVDVNKLPKEMQVKAMYHGIRQALSDVTAGAESDDDMLADIKTRYEGMLNNDWTTRTGTGGPRTNDSVIAIHTVLAAKAKAAKKPEPTVEAIAERWAGMSAEQKKAATADPEVARVKAQLKIEREQKKADELKGKKSEGAGLDELFAA